MAGTKVPRDPNISPEVRRFLDDLARVQNIFDGQDATAATALLNVFTSALKGLVPASGGGTTNFLRADGSFAAPLYPVRQVLQTTYATNADLTTALPHDDTVPASTEGAQILSLAITPNDATNKILATVHLWGESTVAWAAALFRGTTCINVSGVTSSRLSNSFDFLDSPASASAQTYSVRVGSNAGTAVRMNGSTATRLFGGASACTLTLMEIEAS